MRPDVYEASVTKPYLRDPSREPRGSFSPSRRIGDLERPNGRSFFAQWFHRRTVEKLKTAIGPVHGYTPSYPDAGSQAYRTGVASQGGRMRSPRRGGRQSRSQERLSKLRRLFHLPQSRRVRL